MNDAAGGILLATINAKWIHPSLALRLLKANLGLWEGRCSIVEFALRQPLREKLDPILAAQPRILGLSVSIWNHAATLELLGALHAAWREQPGSRPVIVLGGPEVSYLPPEAAIFRYADYCVRGEGEDAFRGLCTTLLNDGTAREEVLSQTGKNVPKTKVFSETGQNYTSIQFVNHKFVQVNVTGIKSGYYLYSDEDVLKKLIYVEGSRGCPYGCEFCQSAISGAHAHAGGGANSSRVREFPLEPFLAEMDDLIRRGARTFKFLDRTFNLDIERAQRIMEFFLEKILSLPMPPVVHFEMVPFRFPPELIESLARFPPGTLRLEIGIQTLNPDVSARIGRPSEPERELSILRMLREQTAAIIHVDLIAGLPGEDMASFAKGFDSLWDAVSPTPAASLPPAFTAAADTAHPCTEIQLGILKLLPGTPVSRHCAAFGMRGNSLPPYELMETAALPAHDLDRIKNFARFWELVVNRGIISVGGSPVFDRFMSLSDYLLAHFGRNWGIDKQDLITAIITYNKN